jgi:hypothetical protein
MLCVKECRTSALCEKTVSGAASRGRLLQLSAAIRSAEAAAVCSPSNRPGPPHPHQGGGGTGLYWTRVSCIYESFPIFKPFLVQILKEIFYLTVAPPFPGSHLNMFLVKKENPPFFIPDPALPGRTYRPRASPVRVLLRRRVSDRYVLPQLASCGEMAIA